MHTETADQDVKEEKLMIYDPLYRLTSATGTEKGIWRDSIPWQEWDTTAPNHVIREYIEHYTYNKTGFMLTQRHQDLGGSYPATSWPPGVYTLLCSGRSPFKIVKQ